MKLLSKTVCSAGIKFYAKGILMLCLIHLAADGNAVVLNPQYKPVVRSDHDTLIQKVILKTLNDQPDLKVFHYPKSVQRFYSQSQFQPVWIASENDVRKTWEGLLLLDCVLQFGLNHQDYHPNELLYSTMHDILDAGSKVSSSRKAWFDMLLTDALIAFINHLHFGKLNPVYTGVILDKGEISGFCADDILRNALQQQDFMSAVLRVQPKIKDYVLMQNYMKLMKGQYVDDCYEAPEGIVRKLAINMERLRWAGIDEGTFIKINIPSYTLKLAAPDTSYVFKVVVGKPGNPTPVLQSAIAYFSTAPDWKVPKNIFIKELLPKALKHPQYLENNHFAIYDRNGKFIVPVTENLLMVSRNPERYMMRQSPGCDNALGRVVFRFHNAFDIYLHDTPEQQFFEREARALSHGCIRVEQAEKLAGILLMLDGQQQKTAVLHQAMSAYQPRTFNLRKPVPLIITYLTCEIDDTGIVAYDDIYELDSTLEFALYGAEKTSSVKKGAGVNDHNPR